MRWLAIFALFVSVPVCSVPVVGSDPGPELSQAAVTSTLDHTPQPIRYWLPEGHAPAPLLVSLHSWSADLTQDHSEWVKEAVSRGWAFVEPNFRGVNNHPQACGSPLARQDILDAIDWIQKQRVIDTDRVYLAGISGGGHMTMLMVAWHPERFSAASAWVGISDLTEWHQFHTREGKPTKYAEMLEKCCGGIPGANAAVDLEYYRRSPLPFLKYAAHVPLDLAAGVTDGKTGSVPIHHSINAFNVIARELKAQPISEAETQQLWTEGHLTAPQNGDEGLDPEFGRKLYLRRTAGASRMTIFEGGHEGLPQAACAWLARQKRSTSGK